MQLFLQNYDNVEIHAFIAKILDKNLIVTIVKEITQWLTIQSLDGC